MNRKKSKRDIVAYNMDMKKGLGSDGQRQERGSWINVCEKNMMFKKAGGGLGEGAAPPPHGVWID